MDSALTPCSCIAIGQTHLIAISVPLFHHWRSFSKGFVLKLDCYEAKYYLEIPVKASRIPASPCYMVHPSPGYLHSTDTFVGENRII